MRQLRTNRGEVIIRTAQPAEAEALRALRLEAITTCPTSFGSIPEEIDNTNWAQIAGRGDDDPGDAMFVAAAGEELIGLTGIYRGKNTKERHRAGLWSVYLRPQWRGLHIVDGLVESAIDWAKQRDVKIVELMVTSINGPAIACYHRCGFRISGIAYATICVDGKFYDEFTMYRWVNHDGR